MAIVHAVGRALNRAMIDDRGVLGIGADQGNAAARGRGDAASISQGKQAAGADTIPTARDLSAALVVQRADFAARVQPAAIGPALDRLLVV